MSPPAALQRARRRRGKLPLCRYHVLEVKPLGFSSRGAHAGEGAPVPIHFVRGHFKTFTEDRPLFGRFTGRYWWQPHLAGRPEAGVVTKDYSIRGEAP